MEDTRTRESKEQAAKGRPDARLLQGVRARDPEALGEFFERYFDRLYNVAYRMVGDHAQAEDVMQEVFLKVHRAAHQLDPDRDPGPWLATLTRNACREAWRRSGRRPEHRAQPIEVASDRGEPSASAGPGPEAVAIRSERDRTILGALMSLPGALREVVVLRDYHGMAHEEVAGVVGARVATVRKRYSRAITALRDRLKDALP